MILAHAHPKTGHPNCRQQDKVIDAGQCQAFILEIDALLLILKAMRMTWRVS